MPRAFPFDSSGVKRSAAAARLKSDFGKFGTLELRNSARFRALADKGVNQWMFSDFPFWLCHSNGLLQPCFHRQISG
jgi:hypothetical protein